jgi:HPt (histidine-containing phosphotransfer) domain-containing protein
MRAAGESPLKTERNSRRSTAREEKPTHMEQPVKAFDADAALERLGGDSELLAELVEAFLQHAPVIADQIRDAAAREDTKALEAAAHSLKGMAANLDAVPATIAAERLELLGHDSDLSGVPEGVADLHSRMEELYQALTAFSFNQGQGRVP